MNIVIALIRLKIMGDFIMTVKLIMMIIVMIVKISMQQHFVKNYIVTSRKINLNKQNNIKKRENMNL